MPGLLIWAIVFGILGLLAFIGAVGLWKMDDDTRGAAIGTLILAVVLGPVIGGGMTLFASAHQVGAQDIGIVTQFGKPVGHVGPGLNWMSPLDQVTSMDEAVQKTDVTVDVKIAGQQVTGVPVSIRWQMNPSAADKVFMQFRDSTSGLEQGKLIPALDQALNTVYGSYDPIGPLASGAAEGSPGNPTTAQLSVEVEKILQQSVSDEINVTYLTVQPLLYDASIKNRINEVLSQNIKTDVAKQAIQTALAQAQANRDLQANLTPLVLVQQCVNGLEAGQIQNQPGFSCWPGSGSGVVLPATGK